MIEPYETLGESSREVADRDRVRTRRWNCKAQRIGNTRIQYCQRWSRKERAKKVRIGSGAGKRSKEDLASKTSYTKTKSAISAQIFLKWEVFSA